MNVWRGRIGRLCITWFKGERHWRMRRWWGIWLRSVIGARWALHLGNIEVVWEKKGMQWR